MRGVAAVQPIELPLAREKHRVDDEGRDTLWPALGICDSERGAPGSAHQNPSIDGKRDSERLDVTQQVLGRIVFNAGMRRRPAAAALIERDDPEVSWIEPP